MKCNVLLLVSIALLTGFAAFADTKYWSNNGGTGDGTWETTDNWSPSGLPAYNDDVVFDDTAPEGSTNVTLNSGEYIQSLAFAKSTDFTITGYPPASGGLGSYYGTFPITVSTPHKLTIAAPMPAYHETLNLDVCAGGRLEIGEGYSWCTYAGSTIVTQSGPGTVHNWSYGGYGAKEWTFTGGGTLETKVSRGGIYAFGGTGTVVHVESTPMDGRPSGGAVLAVKPLPGFSGTVRVTAPIWHPNDYQYFIGKLVSFTTDNATVQDFTIDLLSTTNNDGYGHTYEGYVYQFHPYETDPHPYTFKNIDFTGGGCVLVATGPSGYPWYDTLDTLFSAGTRFNPGSVTRNFEIWANLCFDTNGTQRSKLIVDIDTNSADRLSVIAGGQVTSTNSENRLANCDLELRIAPGDYNGKEYTILTASSDFGTSSFAATNPNGGKATVNYLNGSVTLSSIRQPLPPGTTFMLR